MEQEECSCNKTFLMPSSGADVFHGSKNTTEEGQLWCFHLTGLGLGHSRGSFCQEMEADTEVYPCPVTLGTGSGIPQYKCWPCPREGLPTQSTQETLPRRCTLSVPWLCHLTNIPPFPTVVGRQKVPAGLLLWAKQSGAGQFHLMNCQLLNFTDLGK